MVPPRRPYPVSPGHVPGHRIIWHSQDPALLPNVA